MKILTEPPEEIKNVQFYPSLKRIEPNDKTTKIVFSRPAKIYAGLLAGMDGEIVEVKNHKKHGEITTKYRLRNIEGYTDENPLTEFDRAVLSVCISEWLEGNKYVTIPIIFRALTGKIGEVGAVPCKNQTEVIVRSIEKLRSTEFSADISQSYKKLEYGNGDIIKSICSIILPCRPVKIKINGQVRDGFIFTRESPFLSISNLKRQILSYDTALLNVPKQNNTPLNITLKNYVMRRVVEIIAHRMPMTITFADVFEKCRIAKASSDAKRSAIETITKFFQHLLAMNIISYNELNYNGKSRGILGISFKIESKQRHDFKANFSVNGENS